MSFGKQRLAGKAGHGYRTRAGQQTIQGIGQRPDRITRGGRERSEAKYGRSSVYSLLNGDAADSNCGSGWSKGADIGGYVGTTLSGFCVICPRGKEGEVYFFYALSAC